MFELLFGCLDNNTYGTYKIKKERYSNSILLNNQIDKISVTNENDGMCIISRDNLNRVIDLLSIDTFNIYLEMLNKLQINTKEEKETIKSKIIEFQNKLLSTHIT